MPRPPRFDRGPAARRARWRRIWRSVRYILLLGVMLASWQLWNDPQMRAMLGLPQEPGEEISASFALCDAPGFSRHCVVDGDTFRIGNRRIRIQGIDAPEREGQCPAESEAAIAATNALAAWLNEGAFLMRPEGSVPRDQYGRELQDVWRMGRNGSREDLADTLIRQGHAAAFGSGGKPDWCR